VSRILVLGGYGGFGARIAKRLAAAGHVVLVAGRVPGKARAFCAGNPALVPLALDRKDIAAALAAERPDLVVDASGPFQAMDHAVPRACIAARTPYCDIADGRGFVCGMAALDDEAKAAGVAMIAGCSSVPALSGAVVRELARGMTRLRAVEIAISASNRATAGPAVAAAILGQVGQSFLLYRGGQWISATGWQDVERLDFRVPGLAPVSRRLVAMVDVPDLQLLPARLPDAPAVAFRAGTELAVQNRLPVPTTGLAGLSRV
jgi:saccharopine dehydrogenase-like NADP-dependent oxidoreductase